MDVTNLVGLLPPAAASLTGVTAWPLVMTVILLLGDDLVFEDVDEADEMVEEGLPNLLSPTDDDEVVEGCGDVEEGDAAAAGWC